MQILCLRYIRYKIYFAADNGICFNIEESFSSRNFIIKIVNEANISSELCTKLFIFLKYMWQNSWWQKAMYLIYFLQTIMFSKNFSNVSIETAPYYVQVSYTYNYFSFSCPFSFVLLICLATLLRNFNVDDELYATTNYYIV